MAARTQVIAIVAMDDERAIGRAGVLPWHIPEDLARFRKLTTGQVVVMGRKTWDSLPEKFRPLPNRLNVVVTRSPEALAVPEGVIVAGSAEAALERAREAASGTQSIWIIGGSELYRAMLPECDAVELTLVPGCHNGDAFLPEFESSFDVAVETAGESCRWIRYERR